MKRILDCDGLYSVDLVCDEPLLKYYERFGMIAVPGAARRDGSALHGELVSDRYGRRGRRFPPGQGNRSEVRSYNRHGSPIIG